MIVAFTYNTQVCYQTRYDDVSEDLTVLGCTLHSRVSAEQEESVSFSLNDFYDIDSWTIADHNSAHAADLALAE
ncbi:hypothetical protein RJZ90_004356 [Blastomyces dermatitidis]